MNARSILALGVGSLAAATALIFGVWKQMGVKSYGHPAGRVVRAGKHLCVLIETCDPYMPSLKGVDESRKSYSYAMWVIPEAADSETRTIRLDRGVASGARTHNIGVQQFDGSTLWYTIQSLQGIDLASGRDVKSAPPASLVNAPISQLMGSSENPLEQYRSKGVPLSATPGSWLFLAAEDEAKVDLKPGTRLYDNPGATGTYKPRGLYTATTQPGPIPQIAAISPHGTTILRNGAFMRSTAGGSVAHFAASASTPEGFLVVHQDGDPVHPTIRLSRLSTDGTIAWTADTGIGRLTQILPHARLPAFVGEKPQQLTEPVLTVVDLTTGTARTISLKAM
ncbi:MAG: hypothetical protein QM783_10605 [Phycisphaerales bacterium]